MKILSTCPYNRKAQKRNSSFPAKKKTNHPTSRNAQWMNYPVPARRNAQKIESKFPAKGEVKGSQASIETRQEQSKEGWKALPEDLQ